MTKTKLIVYTVKDFFAMLSVWQLDHTYTKFFWEYNIKGEVARVFGVPLYMNLNDFWVLLVFTLLLAVFSPELYETVSFVKQRMSRQQQIK